MKEQKEFRWEFLRLTLLICICFCMWIACGSESNPTRPRKTVQKPAPVHELTLKNYKKLKASTKYSFVPANANKWTKGGFKNATINWLTWGTVSDGKLVENHDFLPNTPPFSVKFYFDYKRLPYARTDDGKAVIGRNDVVAVRVKTKPTIDRVWGGERGEQFRYTVVRCDAVLVANQSHPERKITYPR